MFKDASKKDLNHKIWILLATVIQVLMWNDLQKDSFKIKW